MIEETPSTPLEQLAALRELTRTTGVLHEAQVLQLRMWPQLLFGACTAKVEVSIPQRRVRYRISRRILQTGRSATDVDQKLAPDILASWVHDLLGREWSVEMRISRGVRSHCRNFEGAR